jgi:hypothetical protein
MKNSTKLSYEIFLFAYTIVAIALFYFYVDPSLQGISHWRWGADTALYMDIAKGTFAGEELPAFSINSNTFGPVFISSLFGNNTFLIAVFNYGLFLGACFLLFKTKNIDKAKLFILLSLSPMLLVSIVTLSKEIIAFFTISLLVYFQGKKIDIYKLLLIIAIATLVRWQMIAVLLMFVILRTYVPNNVKARSISIILLLIIISLIYPSISKTIQLDEALSVDSYTNQSESNSGLIYVLNSLQNNYMLFLSFIPKSIMNLIANPMKLMDTQSQSYDWNHVDAYNDLVVPAQGFITMIALVLAIKNSGISIARENQYFIAIYCIVFSISPFIQTRYFFPIYPILCLEASLRKQTSDSNST